jgi:hypothetical protein
VVVVVAVMMIANEQHHLLTLCGCHRSGPSCRRSSKLVLLLYVLQGGAQLLGDGRRRAGGHTRD